MRYYIDRLRRDGLRAVLRRRYERYRWKLQDFVTNNRSIGRFIELTGNRVRIGGLRFSLNSSAISTPFKSTIWLRGHELPERQLIDRHLPAGLPVIELGGGLGVVACKANRRLTNPEQHLVVEANPEMIDLLTRNRDLNRCRYQVLNTAVAYGCDHIELSLSPFFTGSRLASVGSVGAKSVKVPATTLAALADQSGFDRFSLICDIEGAEADLLANDLDLLKQRAGFLLFEIHPEILGPEHAQSLIDLLQNSGFKLVGQQGQNWAFAKA